MQQKLKFMKLNLKFNNSERAIDIDYSDKNLKFMKRLGKNKSFHKKANKPLINQLTQPKGFKSHWFCKDCSSIFHLKPSPRYKTLLEYNLNCPVCNSENTAHNEELSLAIKEGKSIEELLKFASQGRHINVNITGKFRHYVTFYNTTKGKEIENKEYYSQEPVN